MSDLDSQLYALFDADPAPIVAFLQWLTLSYQVETIQQILDIGCGVGRLLVPLTMVAGQVIGLEPYAPYYETAKAHTQTFTQIQVLQGGFDQINQQDTIDLAIAVNSPFAYLLTLRQQQSALSRCYTALRRGGILLLDVPNFPWILRYYRPPQPSILHLTPDTVIKRVVTHHIDWHDGIFTHIDTFYRNEAFVSTQTHRLAMLSPHILTQLVEQAGFIQIRTYNHYGARAPQRIRQDRILLAAQKPL